MLFKEKIKAEKMILSVTCIIVVSLIFSSCGLGQETPTSGSTGESEQQNIEGESQGAVEAKPEPELPIELTISCVGDIMAHSTQINAQFDAETGTYDFTDNFQYVKPIISEADLALCNLETTFAGEPFTGYPTFSAPRELGTAIKDAGFDVVITANNHAMDKGRDGLIRTHDILNAQGFDVSGTRKNPEKPSYSISEVEGVNIAVLSYTYATKSEDGRVAINGSYTSDENAQLLNHFTFNTVDEDIIKINNDMIAAENEGAEIIILYLHWGEEYQLSANRHQIEMAQKIVDQTPVDIIFASHPHVLQEMTFVTESQTGETVPIFYSMGNFISNQRTETLSVANSKYTEQGIIATVDFEYMKSTGEISNMEMSATPTWVDRYTGEDGTAYAIIPLDENLQNNETLAVSGHLSRAEQALEDVNGILYKD